jgi:hippurate hydrolase
MSTCLRRATGCSALALWLVALTASAAASPVDSEVAGLVDHELDGLVGYYKALHAAPELSRQEEHTAADLARELRGAGFEVTEHVGRYSTPAYKGTGVVAVLRNGAGPTLLVRADMDALPIEEQTGLPYASHRRMKNEAGVEMPVMHACGHDVHVTSLVGTARVLAKLRSRWHGTLILLGQPAEETIDGAQAVIRDGLYERFPRPDLVLALHDSPFLPVGSVGVTPGFAMATSTQMDVMVRGVGGHGSRPEDVKDPVVLAASIVMQLQTIVSREISPFDQAVVTVGTIHGGTKRNIIPNEVKLELNIRAYKPEVREHIIQAVARISRAAALGAGVPEDRLPLVSVIEDEFAPALYNEPATVARVRSAFQRALGAANVRSVDPVMASEDFGYLGVDGKIPVMMFALGANSPERIDEAKRTGVPVHGLHTSRFEPIPAPTLRTGVVAMSTAILEILGN